MCCMIMGIRELNKPQNVWCDFCSTKRSCDNYEKRPEECRTFNCGYLTISYLDDKWKPNKSKIVLSQELQGRRVTAYADPKRPDAWRKEPYYSTLKNWAKIAATQNRQVMACAGPRTYMIFPDRDVDLGIVEPDHHVITVNAANGSGGEALVVHQDDPRFEAFIKQSWHMDTR